MATQYSTPSHIQAFTMIGDRMTNFDGDPTLPAGWPSVGNPSYPDGWIVHVDSRVDPLPGRDAVYRDRNDDSAVFGRITDQGTLRTLDGSYERLIDDSLRFEGVAVSVGLSV